MSASRMTGRPFRVCHEEILFLSSPNDQTLFLVSTNYHPSVCEQEILFLDQ